MSAPIVIPIVIADTGAATLDAVAGQFDNLARAGDKLTASMLGTEKAAQSLQTRFAAVNASYGALTGGVDRTIARQDKLLTQFDAIAVSAAAAGDAMKLYGNTVELMDGQYAGLGRATTNQITRFDAQTAATDRATAAINRQITAMGDLNAVSMGYGGGSAGGGGGGKPPLPPGEDPLKAQRSGLFSNRGVTTLATGHGGPLSALSEKAFSPGGMLTIGGIALAYHAARQNADFQSAEQQTIGQIGGTTDTAEGRANIARGEQTAQAILDYARSGKSPYKATNMMTSIEPLLAHGFSGQAVAEALPSIAQLSGQNKAPDLTNAVQGANTYLALLGKSPDKVTGKEITRAVDYMSRMETSTSILPNQVTGALPRLLTGTIGTGLSADQAGAALLKVGMVNPSAKLDATSLSRLFQEMLVKNTTGAQKTAGELHLAMGPGALNAYGGSFQAMIQAYANATAGPNQMLLLSRLLPQTGGMGGLNAFKNLISGGGTQQTLGYEQQLATSSGASQQAYDRYSKGINQQATQDMALLNADFILLGGTLNQTVTPALLHMANVGLKAFGDGLQVILDWGKKNNTNPAGGTPWDTLGSLLTPGSPGFLNFDTARNRAATGQKDSGFFPAVGNLFDNIAAATGMAPTSTKHTFWDNQSATKLVPVPGSTTGPASLFNPLTPSMASVFAGANGAGATAAAGGAHAVGLDFTGLHNVLGTVLPTLQNFGTGLVNTAQIMQYQANALATSVPASTRNAPTRDARSWLNSMMANGATATEVDKQLALVKSALGKSAYTDAQRADIMGKENKVVGTYERALNGPADQAAVNLAQQNSDAARAMNETPAQLKTVFDQYLDAERKLATDTLTGKPLQKELGRINQQGAVNDYQTAQKELSRQQKDLSNAVQLATLGHNAGGANAARTALYQSEVANAGALGLDKSDLQLLHAQLLAANRGPATPGPTLIRGKESGQGDALAGYGGTTGRLSMPGGENPLAATVRHLEAMLKLAQQQLAVLERSGTTLAAIRDIDEEHANMPPPHTPAPHHAPAQHQRSHGL